MSDELKTPAVGEFLRGHGKLIAIESIAPKVPPPPTQDFIFEAITAQARIMFEGEVLTRFGTFWDYSGEGAAAIEAIKEAQEYATRKKITPDSDLEVVAVKMVEQIRKHAQSTPNPYTKEYRNFEPPDYGCRRDLPGDKEEIIWSSKWL